MTTNTTPAADTVDQNTQAQPETVLDFESDAPLVACPLRNNGDEICEVCQ